MADPWNTEDTDSTVKERNEVHTPRMYSVIMWNDDFTPMDFVVEMLVTHFGKEVQAAVSVMLDVHKTGKGIAGVYTREMAETKVARVMEDAEKAKHPFRVSFEPNATN